MFGRNSKRIGITIDQTGVRYVLLKKKNKTWGINKSGFLPIPEGSIVEDQIADVDLLNGQIKQWVKSEGLVGAISTISVPTSQVIIRRMQIQTTNPKELPQLVALEVETVLHLPFEDPIYDYVKVNTDEVSTHLFIYTAPKKLIHSYANLLEDAGVQVISAELSATALARAIKLEHDELFSDTMVISMDEKLLEIYMFHDGYPIFMRDMSLEVNAEEIARGVLSDEQVREISAEISRMLNFYQYSIYEGLSRITHIIIIGSTDGKQHLLNGLHQSLPDTINIRVIDFASVNSSDDLDINEYRIAMGLALHVKNEGSINLLPNNGREEKIRPFIISLTLITWILIAAALVYFTFDSRQQIQTNNETKLEQNNQMNLLAAKLSEGNKDAGSKTNPQVIVDEIAAHKPNFINSLDDLNKTLPSGAIIRRIAYSNTQFSITVNFNTMEDTARYLFDIRALTSVKSASMQTISGESAGGAATNVVGQIETVNANKYIATYEIKFLK